MYKRYSKRQAVQIPTPTRTKLLQATVRLLAEKGADAVSVKEVARIADVSRAVAYQHFKDRDHLLREAKSGTADLLLKFVLDMPSESIEERTLRAARLILRDMETSKIFIMDTLAGKGIKKDHPIYKMLTKNLKELKARGQGRLDLDIEMATFILLGGVSAIMMLGLHYGTKNVEGLARRFTLEWSRQLHGGIFRGDMLPATKTSHIAQTARVKSTSARPKTKR